MVRRRPGPRALAALAAAGAALALADPAIAAGQATAASARLGKAIYLRGEAAPERPVTALIGDGTVAVPGATLPCVGCHGHDGRGRAESGVAPADITWPSLTRADPVPRATGRRRPAYTRRTLARAITEGRDPGGRPLAAAMPRFRMSPEDLRHLVGYLERLGSERDPGVSETAVRVGTIVPAAGPAAARGRAMHAALAAYFDTINAGGGIYHRAIELRVARSRDTPAATGAAVERFVADEDVFALVGGVIAGAEREIAALAERQELPVVGPVTPFPALASPPGRYVFYLYPGLGEQARALVRFAAARAGRGGSRTVIVHAERPELGPVVEAIADESRKVGWAAPRAFGYAPGRFDPARLARDAREAGADRLFAVGRRGEERALLDAAARLGWTPDVFLPTTGADRELLGLPASFKHKVFVAVPALPSDYSAGGLAEYLALADKHGLPDAHRPAQIVAYGAGRVLVEGLKRAGRDLSRERLVKALEELWAFDIGLGPPITYGPDRRIGAPGARVVTVDPDHGRFVPVGGGVGLVDEVPGR